MKKILKDYIYLLLIAGTIVILDQFTKQLVRSNLHIGNVFMPDLWLSQYVRIVNWQNTGAAFGMFQSLSGVFTVLSIVVGIAILFYYPQVPREDWVIRLAMGFLLGGAMGNLVDRLTLGHVTDFISILFFPVFNIADLSIVTGTIILFFGMWEQERNKNSMEEPPTTDEGTTPQETAVPALPEE